MIKIGICACFLLLILSCSQQKSSETAIEGPKLVLEYNDNGDLKMVGYTIDNKREGEWRFFRKQRLFSIQNYHDGTQHGTEVSFESCTGKVLEEGQYEMGEPVGLWYFYNNGELVALKEYEDGEPVIVYHNPKFKNASGVPPPPPENYDCYQ